MVCGALRIIRKRMFLKPFSNSRRRYRQTNQQLLVVGVVHSRQQLMVLLSSKWQWLDSCQFTHLNGFDCILLGGCEHQVRAQTI